MPAKRINERDLKQAIININHSSEKMASHMGTIADRMADMKGEQGILTEQHNNILNELKESNDKGFELVNRFLSILWRTIVGVFLIVGVKLAFFP